VNTESLNVIDGIVQSSNFDFATVAGTCVNFPDVERTSKSLVNSFAELVAQDLLPPLKYPAADSSFKKVIATWL